MTATEQSVPDPSPGPADLEAAILGATPELTARDVAERAGISLKAARRLWRALGFADADDTSAFTQADVDALAVVSRASRQAGLDFEAMLRITRGLGQTMARLAEWEVATLATSIDEVAELLDRDTEVATDPDVVRAALEVLEVMGPRFEELLVYSWRRHLAATIGRIDIVAADMDDLHVAQGTVGFADVVSFTSLTNSLDEDEIGDLVEQFEARCADIVAEHHGRVVKALGDSVLFLTPTAEEGIETALEIIERVGREPELPDVHVGMASGQVVLRLGDVYGPVVNLASRLTGVARRNRVIIDQATADLLPVKDYETRRLAARPVRGFGDVEPVTVRRTRHRG